MPALEYTASDSTEAARICFQLAEGRDELPLDDADAAIEVGAEIGASARAIRLVMAASRAAPALDDHGAPLSCAAIWRGCAAAIRAGWAPGLEWPEVS